MILIVEDEKFHVHRVILIVNSPVFKVMFKSEFKEATANEVPLPEKKANEVLDFLKQLYVQEREEITSKQNMYICRRISRFLEYAECGFSMLLFCKNGNEMNKELYASVHSHCTLCRCRCVLLVFKLCRKE